MHSAALQLAPILAAEKSKVPFYIAGAVLVLWAAHLGAPPTPIPTLRPSPQPAVMPTAHASASIASPSPLATHAR